MASQCPNKYVMIALEDGTYQSGSEVEKEEEEGDEMPYLMESDEPDFENQPSTDYLVTCRALSAQVEKDETQAQRSNLFHSICFIKDQCCMLIIDSGSCCNIASSYLVEKLKLKTTPHPMPYKLQ